MTYVDGLDPLSSATSVGKRCALFPVAESDLPALYRASVLGSSGQTWRYHGTVPSYAQFVGEFAAGVHAQFSVRALTSGEVCGLVVSYGFDAMNLHVKAGVVVANPGLGLGVEGMFLFLDYLFTKWPIRKVYFEVPEFNLPRLGPVLEEFTSLEGRLAGHLFHDGTWCDQLIYAIDRAGSTRISALVAGMRDPDDGE